MKKLVYLFIGGILLFVSACTVINKSRINDLGEVKQDKSDLIRVVSPIPDQEISNPVKINGQARGYWFFEASFPIKIYDDNDFLLGVVPALAQDDWMTEDFVDFDAVLNFSSPSTATGRLVLERDNPSGLAENDDELIIPVRFQDFSEESSEYMTVNIFLSDSNYIDEPYFDCGRTKQVVRQVPKSVAIGKSAIKALLRGATQQEISQGYVSSINPGVTLKSLVIEQGIAKVDFDEMLEYNVGGSCLTASIQAEIRDTLKQFSTVDDVIISINGRVGDVLQP